MAAAGHCAWLALAPWPVTTGSWRVGPTAARSAWPRRPRRGIRPTRLDAAVPRVPLRGAGPPKGESCLSAAQQQSKYAGHPSPPRQGPRPCGLRCAPPLPGGSPPRGGIVLLSRPPAAVVMAFALASASVVGFSGSRSLASPAQSAAVAAALSRVAAGAVVHVGCAGGVDQLVRQSAGATGWSLVVHRVAFGGRGAFAARSIACVQAVAAAGGVWVAFPSAPCPAGLVPSASASHCFSGAGSGTWASAALAVGLGLSVLVWAPCGAH